ncbi:MAG TPA: hypothetical protein PKC99_16765 [Anaerolineales bacterium]|nr:hypothetical protein [Anaerolineales bacterium]
MIKLLIDILVGGILVFSPLLIGIILFLILLKKLRINKRKKDSEQRHPTS